MVPSGSILTYQAKGTTSWFPSESDIVQEINVDLAQAGVVMRDYKYVPSAQSMVASVDAYLGAPTAYQFTATLQVNADFNSPQDVASLVDHALYTVTGTLPASTVPNVTIPGNAAATTGQPGQTAVVAGTSSGEFDLSSLFESGVNSFALLMVGVILAVVLIVAGKSRSII